MRPDRRRRKGGSLALTTQRWPAALALASALSACAVQLVAPYNPELARRASSLQAEVAAWELQMRPGVGTITDDPRHPGVASALNRWHGEAEAMLTLAVADDPSAGACGEAVRAASLTIEHALAAEMPGAAPAPALAAPSVGAARGCEAVLVARVADAIDSLEQALKYCRIDWIDDAYFAELRQDRFTARKPPAAPSAAAADAVRRSCFAEFRPASAIAGDAGARMVHGRAVSRLSTILQAIVYLENRKRVALAK